MLWRKVSPSILRPRSFTSITLHCRLQPEPTQQHHGTMEPHTTQIKGHSHQLPALSFTARTNTAAPWNNGTSHNTDQRPWNNGTSHNTDQRPWNNGTSHNTDQTPWNNGTPHNTDQRPWNNGTPHNTDQRPWNNGTPHYTDQRPWNNGTSHNTDQTRQFKQKHIGITGTPFVNHGQRIMEAECDAQGLA